MIFWLTLAAATAALLWYMVKVPGVPYADALKPLTADEQTIAEKLREHVTVIASREHNVFRLPMLEQAAQYIENTFDKTGYAVAAQRRISVPTPPYGWGPWPCGIDCRCWVWWR